METSTAETASSRTTSSGSSASARAIDDPLALPTGELARVGPGMLGAKADEVEELADALHPRHGSQVPAMDAQRKRDRLLDRSASVERRERVLEDDLHPAPEAAELGRSESGEVLTVEQHPAGGRLVEPEQQPRQRRLARAGFADEPEGLAAVDRERDAVHGANHVTVASSSNPEVAAERFHRDERVGAHAATSPARCSARWHRA